MPRTILQLRLSLNFQLYSLHLSVRLHRDLLGVNLDILIVRCDDICPSVIGDTFLNGLGRSEIDSIFGSL